MIKELLVVVAAVTIGIGLLNYDQGLAGSLGLVSLSAEQSGNAQQVAQQLPPVALVYDRAVGESCVQDSECRTVFCFNGACRNVQPKQSPRREVIVVDNFYRDAMELRETILTTGVFEVKGNYPGTRTKPMVTESTKDYIVSILGRNFTYWPVDAYNGAFQYTLASHKSWIHCDATEWAGLVYLTPDAPANGGTRFYRHKASRLLERPTDADGMRLGFTNGTALMDYLYKDSQKYDKWDQIDEVGNVFNRLVLFRGFRFHQSAEYFGDNLFNARLFQTFFFDIGGF